MRVQKKDREQRSSTVTWYVTLATQVWGCFENLFYALLLWTVQAASMGNATLYDVMWSWLCTFQLRTALQAAKHEDRSKGLRCGKQFDLEQMKWRHWGWSPFYISDQRGRLNSQFTTSASARTSSFLFVVSGKWSVFHFNKAAFISKGYRKGFCYSSPFKLSKLKRC